MGGQMGAKKEQRVKVKTKFPGVRYREHGSRLFRGKPDRCFFIRYYASGKRVENALGWASEGWTAEKAYAVLADLKQGAKLGNKPQTLSELREENKKTRNADETSKLIDSIRSMTLDDFYEGYFLPVIKKKKRSWSHDDGRYKFRIKDRFGAFPLSLISKEHIKCFMDDLEKAELSQATILHYLAIIRSMMNTARKTIVDGVPILEGRNPVDGVSLPILHNDRERFLTYEEAKRLIGLAKDSGNEDLYDIIILALETGLRRGEIFRLKWGDINFFAAYLTVHEDEHRKPGGKIPLSSRVLELLKARFSRVGGENSSLVFKPKAGADCQYLLHGFSELVKESGINDYAMSRRDKIVFHSLRHTFASWLALAGTDIYKIKKLMRHKTLAMTMRYAHLLPESGRDDVNNLWGTTKDQPYP